MASSYHVVDLGYQLNQGREVNNTIITFRNVRYAAAPTGALRFLAPEDPPQNRRAVQEHPDVIPPQAYPSWLVTGTTSSVNVSDIPLMDPRTSEDCLFLDVLPPKSIWDQRNQSKAAVLVWIPGGGCVVGWKDASGAGAGLVERSTENHEGVILVSVNYRLGLFGWMHGEGIAQNAGLLDQRFALEWVQKYIHLFGGDRRKVTVIGESAGAASLLAHITASGGAGPPTPFRGAILQSPFFAPRETAIESSVDSVLKFSNMTCLEELRAQSTQRLQEINALLVGNAKPFGNFVFQIVKDGHYVQDLPSRLLRDGRFDNKISVMTGHNGDEGSQFVPSSGVDGEEEFENFLTATFPTLEQRSDQLQVITKDLYPPLFDGSQGYKTPRERYNLTIADAMCVSNARALDQAAFQPTTYAYVYTIPPGVHGADLDYTFYDYGDSSDVNASVAAMFQGYITNFAQTRDPNGQGVPLFLPTENGKLLQNIGLDWFGPVPDENGIPRVDERCRFWQSAPYVVPCW